MTDSTLHNNAHYPTFRLSKSNTELAKEVAKMMANIIREAIRTRGEAVIVLSGGSTPHQAYIFLSKEDICWNKVHITLADERWVPSSHPRSNHCLLKTTLFHELEKTPNFIPLFHSDMSLSEGVTKINNDIYKLRKPFDLVLLGMGTDGHTASLFPNGDNLQDALNMETSDWVKPIQAPGALEPRVTMTLRTLLQTRRIFILFSGLDKFQTFMKAREEGAIEDMPIRAVLRDTSVMKDIFYVLGDGQ